MKLRAIIPLLLLGAVSCGPSETNGAECGDCEVAPATGGGSAGVSGLPCDVASVLAEKCVSCHGATPSGGAPNSLLTRDDLLAPSALGGTVASRCVARAKNTAAPMPPSYTGEALAPAEVAALESWIAAGFPGGACVDASAVPGGAAAGGGSGSGAGGGMASGGGGAGADVPAGGGSGGGAGGGVASGGGAGADVPVGGGTGGGSGGGAGGGVASGGGAGGAGGGATTGGGAGGGGTTDGGVATGGGSGGGGGGGSAGTADAGMACTPDTWASYGAAFFADNCSSCHHHAGEFSNATSVRSSRGSITSRITSGNMPQGATLSTAEKTRVLRYLNCNVP